MNDESIQSKGGKARAKALTSAQKSKISAAAAIARWSNRPVNALYRGNLKEQFGVDVDCYVLDDATKTPVFSLRGLSRALGFPDDSGSRLKSFLSSKKMEPFAGPKLNPKLSKPLVFQWGTGGKNSPPTSIHGFDAAVLIDICNVITEAQKAGLSGERFERVARSAAIITGASAKAGIRNLVYALAGYNPTTEEVISAFKLYVQEEAKKYEKEFPDELYAEWHRLYQIPVLERGRSWHFKHLTVRQVYEPLAQSQGKILQLARALKAKGDSKAKLFQFLSEVGTRALRFHLGRLVGMAEDAENRDDFERKFTKRFGGQSTLSLELSEISPLPSSKKSL